jgi:hypothetical protein
MIYVFLCLLAFGSTLSAQDVFRYPVELKRFPRSERGEIMVDNTGVSYKSEDGKRSIHVAPINIHEADVSDPRRIRIETYQNLKRKFLGRQSYTFRLRETEHGPELARFLAALLKRPVVGFRDQPAQGETYEIPAYHRHRFGGCNGTLRINAAGIQFVSDKAGDSRSWPYSEIETVGTMNTFHFRVSTLNETYNFDLKDRLEQAAYNLSFKAVAHISSSDASKERYNRQPVEAPTRE